MTWSQSSLIAFRGEIFDEIYTPLAQLDFSAELARISSLKPEAVFAFYPGGLAVAFVKQYDQAGLTKTVPLYGGFPLVDETVRKAQGKASVGLADGHVKQFNAESAKKPRWKP